MPAPGRRVHCGPVSKRGQGAGKSDADYAAGRLNGLHFPLACIDINPPARFLNEQPRHSRRAGGLRGQVGMPGIPVYLFFHARFGIFLIESSC